MTLVRQAQKDGYRVASLHYMTNFEIAMLINGAAVTARSVGEPEAAGVVNQNGKYYLMYDPRVCTWDPVRRHLHAE